MPPGEHVRPRRIGRERGLAVRVVPLRARVEPVQEVGVLVGLRERHEARDLDRSVGVEHRQLLRVGLELCEVLRRRRDSLRLEHRRVVVEAVRVREHRERALIAPIARVAERLGRDDLRDVHPVRLKERAEVLVGVRGAELRHVVRTGADRDVRGLPGVDRANVVLVHLPRRVVDRDPRILRRERVQDVRVLLELPARVEAPHVERDGRVRSPARRVDRGRWATVPGRRAAGSCEQPDRHHSDHQTIPRSLHAFRPPIRSSGRSTLRSTR